MINFKNKKILITGATGGIGNELVKKFLNLGGNIIATGTKTEKLEIIKKRYPSVKIQKFDISEHSKIEEFISNVVLDLGGLDVLINNAGITRDTLLMRMKDEDWNAVIQTNLTGAAYCTRAVIRPMIRQKNGCIINISSIVGIVGNAGQANYAAAKAGMVGLTKSVAKEVANRGIRVNAIAPGFITTDMTAEFSEENRKKILDLIPMKSFGSVEDVAEVSKFLASSCAQYITGQVIQVDGGMGM